MTPRSRHPRKKQSGKKNKGISTHKNEPVKLAVETLLKENWFKKYWRKIVGFGVIISILSGLVKLIIDSPTARSIFDTPMEKNQKKNFTKTILDPMPLKPASYYDDTGFTRPVVILNDEYLKNEKYKVNGILIENFDTLKVMTIGIGGTNVVQFEKQLLMLGIRMQVDPLLQCNNAYLDLVVFNNYLYLSTRIVDFKSEQTIGILKYNFCKLYTNGRLDYDDTNNQLTVYDYEGNVALSAKYHKETTALNLNGYFLNEVGLAIMRHDQNWISNYRCVLRVEKGWKEIGMDLITSIPRSN